MLGKWKNGNNLKVHQLGERWNEIMHTVESSHLEEINMLTWKESYNFLVKLLFWDNCRVTRIVRNNTGNSLAVQWLGLGAFTAVGPRSILGRGTEIPQDTKRSQKKKKKKRKKEYRGTSLVAQWLRICLPIQGREFQALVREDPTCHWATNPMRRNY